jgi:hypothetical protein
MCKSERTCIKESRHSLVIKCIELVIVIEPKKQDAIEVFLLKCSLNRFITKTLLRAEDFKNPVLKRTFDQRGSVLFVGKTMCFVA